MSLVDMHSSWLVINSVVGCTNSCKYCFLQDKNNNLCSPRVLGTPFEAVKELLSFKYYDKSLPLCLFPNTDIFLNNSNIQYLLDTLKKLEEHNVNNDLILITKCLIPKEVLLRLKELKNKGRNIVVYLSSSGLDKDVEPKINHEDIKQNFINLYNLEVPVVHYYRPFIPQDSKPVDIKRSNINILQYLLLWG